MSQGGSFGKVVAKISEQWLEKKVNIKNKDESEDADESDTPPKKEMVFTKIKKK